MKFFITIVMALSGTVCAFADSQTVNTDALLKELQSIKNQQQNTIKVQREKIIQLFQSAASSPGSALDLYMQAVEATRFDGQNHEITQFREWRKKQADKLKDKGFQEALRLHLVYLVLTLENAGGLKPKDLLPSLVSYTSELLVAKSYVGNQELLDKDLNESIFVKWYGISGMLAGGTEGWVMAPGSFDEIYQKTILPILREKKDPAAVEYWNEKMQREYSSSVNSGRTFDAERYSNITKPGLLWSRAMEYCLIGQKSQGFTEMLAIIKSYPTHPSASQWISQFEGLLSAK